MHLLVLLLSILGTGWHCRLCLFFFSSPSCSQIILALLHSGDAYLVDLRKKHRGRVELEEVQDDSDEELSASPRSVLPILFVSIMRVFSLPITDQP